MDDSRHLRSVPCSGDGMSKLTARRGGDPGASDLRHPLHPSAYTPESARDHHNYGTPNDNYYCTACRHYHNDDGPCTYTYNVPGFSASCGCPVLVRRME